LPLAAVLLLVAAVPAGAAPPGALSDAGALPDLLGRIPGDRELGDRYRESDAVVLFDSTIVNVHGDGRISRRHHRAVLLLTDNAIRRYGDPRILYHTARQTLDIAVARVYMRDRTAVDTQDNGFNLTTPFSLALAPDYADWQEMVVTHVGIEKGCVAELVYTITDKEARRFSLSGFTYFAGDDPAIERTLVVAVPAGTTLQHAAVHGAPEPERGARGHYIWRMNGLRGRAPVDAGVWRGDYLPTVFYGTEPDWSTVLDYWSGRFDETPRESGAALGELAGRLQGEAHSDEELVALIQSELLERIRLVDTPYPLLSENPRSAEEIYRSTYASPLDRAVVLVALLREAGIGAVPVLPAPGETWPAAVTVPEIFERIFVAVTLGNGMVFIDPESAFDRDMRLTIPGRTYAVLEGAGVTSRLDDAWPPEGNESILTLDLELGDDVTGEGIAVLTGVFSPYYAIRGVGDETKEWIEGEVSRLMDGAEVSSWNLNRLDERHVEIGFRLSAALPDETAGVRRHLALPAPFCVSRSGIDRIRVERSGYPVPIGLIPCVLEVRCTFTGTSDYAFAVLPRAGTVTNRVGNISVDVTSDDDGTVAYTKRLEIGRRIVGEDEYGMLRSLLVTFYENRVVLEPND
jgi:hypothetical protein